MGLFSSKKTTNITENRTDVSNYDQRVAAADEAIALGQGSSLDQSFFFHDESKVDNRITDNSDRRITDNSNRSITDNSDRSVKDSRSYVDQSVTNLELLDDDVALASISAARALGGDAVSLVNAGLAAQVESVKQGRLLSETALGVVADNTRKNLADTLALVDGNTARSLAAVTGSTDRALTIVDGSSIRAVELARELARKGQEESAAARSSAAATIKEVLGFKEAGDTKVAESLIKYGAIAAALLAAVFIFRGRKA